MPRKVHYVLSTHWDREWYQTFQDFRYRLVRLFDNLLEGWQNGRLKGPFQTDGQVIVLEDYLEVRPERREQVLQLLREGRLVTGPWYVLPDEFLVSGESLVRNLEMGRRMARQLGVEPSNAGFLCDMFGHNSQMPQIFSGFGIPLGFIWRGNNLVDTRQVVWRGADGSELLCYRFGETGYCTYAVKVRMIGSGSDGNEAEIAARQDTFLKREAATSEAGPLLAFDGGDHQEWDPVDYAVLSKRFGKADGEFHIEHTSLDAYIREMLPFKEKVTACLEGELREPGLYPDAVEAQWLIAGVGSSRVPLKQANNTCQNLLCQWAEPFSAFAAEAAGLAYPQGYLDTAWKWLLQNHPHDSICGCSVDAVHEDMMYRFHQSEQIARRLTLEATRLLTASVAGEPGENEVRAGVFNPLPQPLREMVDLDLELPLSWPKSSNEMSNSEGRLAFRIFDAQGNELPYQLLGQQLNHNRWRVFYTAFAQGYRVNVVRVTLPLDLPALGYTTLTVRANEPGRSAAPIPLTTPGLATGERSMANQALSVTIESDGTLSITDLRSGQSYSRLLTFEDCADIGDGWDHGPAVNDQVFYSTGSRINVALVHNGRFRTTFRVRTQMELPAEFDFNRMARGEEMVGMQIDSLVTLRAGAERVEVETTVRNNVKDHRLRVLFPSGAAAKTYLADTPFDVVKRPIALRADNHLYREAEIETKPQQTMTAAFDEDRGLALVSTGLHESAVIDLPERPLALTLFRATRKTVGTDGEPGGQVQGELRFRYWIQPLSGEVDRAQILRLGQLLSGGVQVTCLDALDVRRYRAAQALPAQGGFLEVEGDAVLTSLRQVPAGLEARLFNPSEKTVQARLEVNGWPEGMSRPGKAQPVDFEHHPVGEAVAFVHGQTAFSLGPKQILTVLFE